MTNIEFYGLSVLAGKHRLNGLISQAQRVELELWAEYIRRGAAGEDELVEIEEMGREKAMKGD